MWVGVERLAWKPPIPVGQASRLSIGLAWDCLKRQRVAYRKTVLSIKLGKDKDKIQDEIASVAMEPAFICSYSQ